MIATSSDVAKLAGVSRATVSQILNGHAHRFAPETTDRVLQAASELDYRPSIAGRALARGSSDIVIALIPNTTFGANFQDIFEALTVELATRGLTLLLRLSTPAPNSLDRVLTSIRPRAVLSLAGFTADERSALEERGILAIETPASAEENPISQIATTQVRHLAERGHRKLAFAHLEDERQELYGHIREASFARACEAEGLPAPLVLSLDLSMSSALRALDGLGERGFGVACYNDDVATALLAAARERDWKVPEDIALIGLDNTPLSQLTNPPLTTIEYDLRTVTDGSTDWALARLDGRDASKEPTPIQLRVIQGGTT